jgi:tetratricopeptide (TPR) repeat protein/transglutaminase-like putative cysteine protease
LHARTLALAAVLAVALPGVSFAAAPAPAPAAAAPAAAPATEAAAADAAVDALPPELPEPAPRLDDPYVAELEGYKADAHARVRTPEAALPLLRAFNLRERLSTLAPLAHLLGEFVEWSAVHPEVRSLARHLLAQVQRSRGRMPYAQEQVAKLGFVTRLWIAGPFDNEGKSGCETAWAPEKNIDFTERFQGKQREVGWRKLPDLSRDGYIDLGATLSPSAETVAYALTVVDSPSEQKVVLHLGTSGASRLFVNGTKVYSDDAYHAPRFDQGQVGVTLKKGANRVMLKLCQDTGAHGFYLRVSGASGDAVPNLTVSAPDVLPPLPKGNQAHEAMTTLVDYFRKKVETSKGDPKAQFEYAEMLVHKQVSDVKDKREAAEAAKAAQLLPKDVPAQMLAAFTTDDANERRKYLEAALAIQPLHAGASWGLARYWLAHDMPRRSLEFLEPAVKKHPKHFPLALLQARALEELSLPRQADAIFETLARTFSDRPEVVRESSRMARRHEKVKESVALLRVAISLRYDDLESRRMLIAALADLGDVEAALKEQREVDALEPWEARSWLRLGEFAAVNGRGEEARAAFAKAIEIAPEEADVFERQGQSLARLGDTAGAIAAFSRSLELRPQNPLVKETLKALRREGKGFGEDLAWDAVKLAARSKPMPGEDAVALADFTAVKVHSSGLASRFEQVVIRVQTDRGVESERSQWITVSPDRQELKILRARIIRPDGSLIENHTESERSLSDGASRLYYDTRGRIISFPNLSPGDVIELAYRLDDTAADNLLSDYFGDVDSIQAEIPKEHFDFVLSMPKGRTIYASSPGVKLELTDEQEPDGTRLYRWSAKNVAKIVPEPGMPGRSEVAAQLHVSTYKDWDAVGRYYWGLIRDELTPTDEIKIALKEILAGVPKGDEPAALRAVYDFVVTKTRYVGLEFGIHGFKPYKVDKVLSRRFGDCKDKASLMHSLLEAAGIDSRLVLLRMRRLGRISPTPASLAIFDHAILYVPKYDLFLDGTAELYGSRELPAEDHGAVVLVIEPGGGSKLATIPEGKAQDNLTRAEYQVTLAPDGSATLTGTATVSGLSAPEYRHSFQQSDGRAQRYEQGWARAFPGIKVRDFKLSDLDAIEKDVQMSFEMDAPSYATREADALTFTPFGQGATYVESFAPLAKRSFDLVLGFPWTNRFRYKVTLPQGAAATDLPKEVDVQSPFGAVKLAYRMDGPTLVAEGEVMISAPRIAAAEYPAFRTFLGQVDQALGRRIKITGATKTSSSR